MISFSNFGSDVEPPSLAINSGWLKLSQHWLHSASLVPPAAIPAASIMMRADGKLVFTARMRPSPGEAYQPGKPEFITGLWKGNVVEMFLCNPHTGRYMEVHLSPSFAWWACLFSDVRVSEQLDGRPLPLSVVQHRTDKGHKIWQGTVEVPGTTVCNLLGVHAVTSLTGNVAAIYHPQTGPPCYFSHATMPGPKPDFHQPRAWLPLRSSAK